MTRPSPTCAVPLEPLVRSRVKLVRRALLSVRWAQGLCLGVAAAVLALAAGVEGGAPLFSSGLLWVALLNGLTVLGLWLYVHRRNAAEVARAVDLALGCDGALFTAWEVEGERQPGELARRLSQQVAASATPPKMLRASLPASLPLLIAPFAALTLLIMVIEEQRSSPIGQDLAGLARLVEEGLASLSPGDAGQAEGAAAALSAVENRDLRELMRRAGALSESIAAGEADGEQLADMADELAQMETTLGERAGDDLRTGLRRTQTALDAARMALEGHAGSEGAAQISAGGESSSGTGLASTAQDGKLSAPTSSSTRALPGSEIGVLGTPSWPTAYDGIVERWVEDARQTPPR